LPALFAAARLAGNLLDTSFQQWPACDQLGRVARRSLTMPSPFARRKARFGLLLGTPEYLYITGALAALPDAQVIDQAENMVASSVTSAGGFH
jgi:hypothetical protein